MSLSKIFGLFIIIFGLVTCLSYVTHGDDYTYGEYWSRGNTPHLQGEMPAHEKSDNFSYNH